MPASEAQLAIDVALLQELSPKDASGASPLPWSNLGKWTSGSDYRAAAAALARDLGNAVQLQPTDHVLDLACGYGASLALWESGFRVQVCDAVEGQQRCTAWLRQQTPGCLRHLHEGWLETFEPEPASYDVLLCVDAAYHFATPEHFPLQLHRWLRPGGRFAFHTLVLKEAQRPTRWKTLLQQAQLVELAPRITWEHAWEAGQWDRVTVEDLTRFVLGGFPVFVQNRRAELSWRNRMSRGWAKIVLTAWLCRVLQQEGRVQYVRISGRKR